MTSITLLSVARESLATNPSVRSTTVLVAIGLVMVLFWAIKVAGTALAWLLRAAVTATVVTFAVAVIPVVLLALLFLSVTR